MLSASRGQCDDSLRYDGYSDQHRVKRGDLLPGVSTVVIAPLQPTVCHYFIRLLKEKGLLLRCYTQVGGAAASREEGRLLGPGACVLGDLQ